MRVQTFSHDRTHSAPPRAHRRRHRIVGAGLVAALAASTFGLSLASSASAEDGIVGPGIQLEGVLDLGPTWLGAIVGSAEAEASGWLSYCLQAGLMSPNGAPAEAIGSIDDPELAYIIGQHEADNTELSRAAIGYLVHSRHDQGNGSVTAAMRRAQFVAAAPQSVKDQANAFLQEAAVAAGPYTSAVPTADYTTEKRTGVVRDIALLSESGAVLAGEPMTVTLVDTDLATGAITSPSQYAVWDVNGTTSYSAPSPATPLTLNWTGIKSTPTGVMVTAQVDFGGLKRTTLTKYSASGQIQDSLSYGNRDSAVDPETVSSTSPRFDVVVDFQPQAVSTVAAKIVEVGADLVDTAEVSAAAGDTWATVDGALVPVTWDVTAYSTGLVPAAQSAQVPVGAPALGSVQVVTAGPGTGTATFPGLATGQFVTYVWSETKANQPAEYQPYIRDSFAEAYGIAQQTTSVRHNTTDIDSTLTTRVSKDGSYLVDDLFVEGLPEDHPNFAGGAGFAADVATLDQSLLFFPWGTEVLDTNLDAATSVATVTVPAKNGFYPSIGSTKFLVAKDAAGTDLPGTYVFRTTFAGDDRVAPFASSVEDVTEQFVILPEAMTVTTQAQSSVEAFKEGDTVELWDNILVEDTVPQGGATSVVELFTWEGDVPVCEAPVWTSEPVTFTEAGVYPTNKVDVSAWIKPGLSFGFRERTTENESGKLLSPAECGIAAETLTAKGERAVTPPAPEPTTPAPVQSAQVQGAGAVTQGAGLAVTGAGVTGLAVSTFVLLALGTMFVVRRHRTAELPVEQSESTL
jgi:hypothetical protein